MALWWSPADVAECITALRDAGFVEGTAELTLLGEGFGSVALESQNGVVVLVAKNEIGADARRVSTALLPELGPAMPFAVPQPIWTADGAKGLRWGAWAYEKLPGRLMTDENCRTHGASLAGDMAVFLASLHAFDTSLATSLGVPSRESFWAMLRKVRSDIDEALRKHLALHEYLRVQAWWDAFSMDDALLSAPEALVHADLWPDNLLVTEDGAHLSGVIDWGDVTVLDVAYDFAPLHHSGDAFAAECLAAYVDAGGKTDSTFAHRVQRYRELRGGSFFSLRAAIREHDEGELQDCLQKLRASALLR